MNCDLISRDAMIDVIDNMDWYHVNSKGELVHGATSATGLYRFEDIMSALENAPAVEAEPVVHAHWEQYTDEDEDWGDLPYFKCSACGTVELTGRKRCPECGAHMDEQLELRTCYCPICDKHFQVRSTDSMGDCPDCGHHVVLHGRDDE